MSCLFCSSLRRMTSRRSHASQKLKLGIGKIKTSINTSRARLLLPLLLMRLHMVGYLSILFREDVDDTNCYFVVDDSFIVLSDDVNTKFLEYIQDRNAIIIYGGMKGRTTLLREMCLGCQVSFSG